LSALENMKAVVVSGKDDSKITLNDLLRNIDDKLKKRKFETLNEDEKVTSKAFVCAILIVLYASDYL